MDFSKECVMNTVSGVAFLMGTLTCAVFLAVPTNILARGAAGGVLLVVFVVLAAFKAREDDVMEAGFMLVANIVAGVIGVVAAATLLPYATFNVL